MMKYENVWLWARTLSGALTPSASAAALGHKNMQAHFYDARFARYWAMSLF